MFFTSNLIDSSKIPVIEYNGKKYQVLDFTKLNYDDDLTPFGFEKGTTVDNFRLFVHTVNDKNINNLENVYYIQDANNQGLLCASYISVEHCETYRDNSFGVSLTAENVNIANADNRNLASGTGKTLSKFIEFVTDVDEDRTLIPDSIKSALDITDEEYSELYRQIQPYKTPLELEGVENISIGDKTFTGKEIKQVITEADDLMLHSHQHSEANLYSPKTNAVIAKVDKIEEIPQELLNFAQKHELPIYILGKHT